MTNYEVIKNMSLEEMAAVFYMIEKPFMDAFNLPKEEREKVKAQIMDFLTKEPK